MDRPNRSHPTLYPLTSLPTSPSYLHPTTSIPTTPSLLSRPASQTRLRPLRSLPTSISTPTFSQPPHPHPHPYHHQQQKMKQKEKHRGSVVRSTYAAADGGEEESWITRTASALTLTRLEEKGQSWLVARTSSTSLDVSGAGYDDDEEEEDGDKDKDGAEAAGHYRNRSSSAKGSNGNGNVRGRRGQRRQSSGLDPRGDHSGRGSLMGESGRGDEDADVIGPDFVDVQGDEEEGGEKGEEIDEGEMKRIVMGRVGGWVDWAVGWMDFRGEDDPDPDPDSGEGIEGDDAVAKEGKKGQLDAGELRERLRRRSRREDEEDDEEGEEEGISGDGEGTHNGVVGCAPETAGVWSDARWLLGVAAKAAL